MIKPNQFTAGLWPRGVALLTRQALESALQDLWRRRGLGIANASARAQLLCLREYLRPEEVADQVNYVWSGLSRACHYHAYELPPTADELQAWIDSVSRLVEAVETVTASPSRAP